jgi:hypothetical protein
MVPGLMDSEHWKMEVTSDRKIGWQRKNPQIALSNTVSSASLNVYILGLEKLDFLLPYNYEKRLRSMDVHLLLGIKHCRKVLK